MAIHSQRIEKHVLAGFLNYPDLVIEVDIWLSEKDFFVKEHQTIFSVIRSTVVEGNEEVDNVLIANKINNLGITFEKINIFDYLRALKGITITRKNALEACQELSKIRISREIDETLDQGKEFLRENLNSDIDSILTGCDNIYNSKLDSYTLKEEPKNLFEGIEDFIEEIGNNPHEETGLATGFKEFNRMYGGLMPGNIYAIVSRPGQGKSTWIQNLALKTSLQNDVSTLICDTEMNSDENKFRLMASISGVPLWDVQTGKWRESEENTAKIREALKRVKGWKYHHVHVANKPIDQVCSMIRRWYYTKVGRGNPAVVAVDYIKLTGEKVGQNWAEHQAIGEKIDKLKKLAEDLQVPIITAMQLNRSGEGGRHGSVVDDASAISLSDRLQWFASFVAIFRRKRLEELAADGEEFGSHKLIPLKTRWQGRDAAGHQDLFQRREDPNDPDSDLVWVSNYLNFHVDNFNIDERGSVADIIRAENGIVEVQDLEVDEIDTI
tara:strand:+ start:2419 stop:3906 length:1488 start_codon:yes stop_codon:yes gene_type:complete